MGVYLKSDYLFDFLYAHELSFCKILCKEMFFFAIQYFYFYLLTI